MSSDIDLATTYRQIYHSRFLQYVEAGRSTPFFVPFYFIGLYYIPTLYLAIPHRNRPWFYHTRWLVLTFVIAFHLHIISRVSSMNFAAAYGAGLTAAWGILWNLTLLVWTNPQMEAKRVEVRSKTRAKGQTGEQSSPDSTSRIMQNSGASAALRHSDSDARVYATPQAGDPMSPTKQEASAATTSACSVEGNGVAKHDLETSGIRERHTYVGKEKTEMSDGSTTASMIPSVLQRGTDAPSDQKPVMDLDKAAAEQELEYYWQAYPANASFWTRLDWAFDIVSTMRMTGWNSAINCLPPYKPPPHIGDFQLPLNFGSHNSKQGYTRTLSRRELLISRLVFNIIPAYFVTDFCAVMMTADPYFILGPEHSQPLPPHLASLPPLILSMRRTALAFAGTIAVLQLAWNFGTLCLAFLLPPFLGFRAHPWHMPTFAGSFNEVLDRGFAGFWGGWWHQSFRFGFAAPTRWLTHHGYLQKGTLSTTLAGLAIAFLQSGFLHASASFSTVPETKWWLPPMFFVTSGIGVVVQTTMIRYLRHQYRTTMEKLPRWARRAGNLVFVFGWLTATSWLLIDDLCRGGLWLYEPVPFSLFRAFTDFGDPRDRRIWRYGGNIWPRWYWAAGGRWWNSGIAI